MPIRPVDVLRSQEVSQIRHSETQRMASAQAQSSKNLQDEIQKESTRASETSKSDDTEYRYDSKEKGNNPYYDRGRKKKDKKNKKTKDQSSGPEEAGGIDILI